MIRVIARQAEAERERRAKVINAEVELQAAQKLLEAAEIMSARPEAIQLRYLGTLTALAAQNRSTTLFPFPLDLICSFPGGAALQATRYSTPSYTRLNHSSGR